MIKLSDDYDDYDDIIDQLKKYFNIDSKLFDMDFFIFPEFNKNIDPKSDVSKGFKISYHFEKGMEKPEIKIEGNIDEKELHNYLKNYNMGKNPKFKLLKSSTPNNLIDATELSLEPYKEDKERVKKEPCSEINDCNDFTEIILEVPGIQKEDITLTLDETGNKITFSAQNNYRKYNKDLYLPFKTSLKDYNLEVNNGIAILRVWRIESKVN